MNEKQISNILYSRLARFGAIKWYKNSNHSFYLKFKDVRLGSIRIANHPGRERYHYTYEIFKKDKDIEQRIEEIVRSIELKSNFIHGFDPDKYIVYDINTYQYIEVESFNKYRNIIFKKNI